MAPAPPGPPHAAALVQGLEALKQRYPLSAEQVAGFRRDKYIRLRDVVPPAVLAAARAELIEIAAPAMGGRNASDPDAATRETLLRHQQQSGAGLVRGPEADELWAGVSGGEVQPWHVQMGWTLRPAARSLVLSPRIGGIVSELLGVGAVRLYHDNTLSRCPGSPRTRWHCDDGPDPVTPRPTASERFCTARSIF